MAKQLGNLLGIDLGVLLASHLPSPVPTKEVGDTEPELWKKLRQTRSEFETAGAKLKRQEKLLEKAKAATEQAQQSSNEAETTRKEAQRKHDNIRDEL